MINLNSTLTFLLLLASLLCFPQKNSINISIQHVYGNQEINLIETVFTAKDSKELQLEVLKYYLTNLEFLKHGIPVLQEQNSIHLVDASAKSTLQFSIENALNQNFDSIRFCLGVDSLWNVSGAYGGDLDPTKGMYWTWQSGYINLKIEGTSALCNNKDKAFQFHIGGYQNSQNALQCFSLKTYNSQEVKLRLDVEKALSKIDLSKQNRLMLPSPEAVEIAKQVSSAFYTIEF